MGHSSGWLALYSYLCMRYVYDLRSRKLYNPLHFLHLYHSKLHVSGRSQQRGEAKLGRTMYEQIYWNNNSIASKKVKALCNNHTGFSASVPFQIRGQVQSRSTPPLRNCMHVRDLPGCFFQNKPSSFWTLCHNADPSRCPCESHVWRGKIKGLFVLARDLSMPRPLFHISILTSSPTFFSSIQILPLNRYRSLDLASIILSVQQYFLRIANFARDVPNQAVSREEFCCMSRSCGLFRQMTETGLFD